MLHGEEHILLESQTNAFRAGDEHFSPGDEHFSPGDQRVENERSNFISTNTHRQL